MQCAAIAGVHGHGQPDLDKVEGQRRRAGGDNIRRKWQEYCERLRRHLGSRSGVYMAHHAEDGYCPNNFVYEQLKKQCIRKTKKL